MKLYLASGWFDEGQQELRTRATKELEHNGTVDAVFYPYDHQTDSGLEFGTPEWAEMQFKIDMEQLKSADALVVLLTGNNADSGTSFEQGAAYAYGKPIVYVSDLPNGNLMNVMGNTYATTNPEELSSLNFNILPTNKWGGEYI